MQAQSPAQIQQAQREADEKRVDDKCRAWVDWAGASPAIAASVAGDPAPPLRLFADPVFKPVFGKAFDDLSPAERLAIHNDSFLACIRSRTYSGAVRELMGTLVPPFQDAAAAGVNNS